MVSIIEGFHCMTSQVTRSKDQTTDLFLLLVELAGSAASGADT